MPKKSPKSEKAPVDAATVQWWNHDIYPTAASSSGRIVTRSQTCFSRIKNDDSDVQLFSDPERHQPPGLPHLMVTMKGTLGAVPRTIITRSYGQHMQEDKRLIEKLEPYKNFCPETTKTEEGEAEKKEEGEGEKKEEADEKCH